jgi:hypothetical protein
MNDRNALGSRVVVGMEGDVSHSCTEVIDHMSWATTIPTTYHSFFTLLFYAPPMPYTYLQVYASLLCFTLELTTIKGDLAILSCCSPELSERLCISIHDLDTNVLSNMTIHCL